MNNKLSELSKPVAWKLHHHDRYYFEENADVVAIAESVGKAKGDAVYSQEYVSALDKVAQFWIGESAGWKQRAEDAEKRIAELEAKTAMTMGVGSGNGNLFVHGDYDSIKAAQAIVLENESLRAKLATPVRLPDDLEPNTEPCVICGVVSSHPEGWHYCHPKCVEGDA